MDRIDGGRQDGLQDFNLDQTTEEMKAVHRGFGMTYGSLLWMRSNGHAVNVPLSLLTPEQKQRLEGYLKHGELLPGNTHRARLVWEYANQTDGGYLVQVIELTKEQRSQLDPPKRRPSTGKFVLKDFCDLRDRVSGGSAGWREAIMTLESLTHRPWSTKEWKEMRDQRIGARCSSCKTDVGPMVLQHTRQPRKPQTIIRDYEMSHRQELRDWIAAHQPRIDLSKEEKSADACPRCGSQTIRHRWTLGIWVCVAVRDGIQCGHRFRDPTKQVPNSVARKLWEATIQAEKTRFLDQTGLGRQIALEAINEMIRYLEMKDTKTLCKACAFVEDRLQGARRARRPGLDGH